MSDPARYHGSGGEGLALVCEPNLRRIADYWRARRNGRLMPRREEIDPVDISWALSRFYLVDYERGTDTYRYRIAGSHIESVFGESTGQNSMKGMRLEEMLTPDGAALVRKRWKPLAENGAVIYMRGLIYLAAERVAIGARLMLPLADGGDGQVTGFMGYTECDWRGPTELEGAPGLDIWYIPLDEIDGP